MESEDVNSDPYGTDFIRAGNDKKGNRKRCIRAHEHEHYSSLGKRSSYDNNKMSFPNIIDQHPPSELILRAGYQPDLASDVLVTEFRQPK
jgi:hypothetical protein